MTPERPVRTVERLEELLANTEQVADQRRREIETLRIQVAAAEPEKGDAGPQKMPWHLFVRVRDERDALRAQRDELKRENESFRKNYVTRFSYEAVRDELRRENDDLQRRLDKIYKAARDCGDSTSAKATLVAVLSSAKGGGDAS